VPGSNKYTLDYYYAKKTFQRIIKRLEEDISSIWYDNLDQQKQEFAEVKEIYDMFVKD